MTGIRNRQTDIFFGGGVLNGRYKNITSNPVYWLAAAALLSVLTPNPAWGLLLGSVAALWAGNPAADRTGKISKKLLQAAVILLGFGMHFDAVVRVGITSVWVTMISISATMLIGTILGKIYGVERDLSVLLSTGTAICGGSAIAAMSPSIGASQSDTGVAMAVVFLLNGIALLIFPMPDTFSDSHRNSSASGPHSRYMTKRVVGRRHIRLSRACCRDHGKTDKGALDTSRCHVVSKAQKIGEQAPITVFSGSIPCFLGGKVALARF